MKNLKKILALVLAFACAFTMFAVAGAADFTDKASIKNYEAVNTLVALNILKGRDNGSFDPDATVTRAEMTKMIYVIWNGGKDDATAYEGVKSNFSDVSDHWARGYINFCASNNIVAGMGDGTFAPDQTVTGQQAAKMLLVLMGYDDKNAGLTGPKWAQNTMNYASLAGLFKDVNSPLEQGMPRQYAAQMVYNTLEANRVKWSTDNGSFDEITQWSGKDFVKETVGERYMNYTTVTGILVEARNGDQKGFSILRSPNDNGKYSLARGTSDEKTAWNTNLWVETKYTTDLSEYLGQEVKVSYNSNEYANNRASVYGVFSTNQNVVVTTTANKIADSKEASKVKIDGVKYKVDDDMRYYYSTTVNGQATDLTLNGNYILNDGKDKKLESVFVNKNVEVKDGTSTVKKSLYAGWEPFVANTVKFVDYDNDGKFDLAIDYPMAVAEVSMVSSSTISVKDVHGVTLSTNAPKREDVVAYDGIAKGDIVQITWDVFQDKVKFTKMTTTDETVGSVRNDVGGANEEYNISTGWVQRFSTDVDKKNGAMGSGSITTKLKSGDKATFVVIGGIAYYVDRTQSGTGNDVAVVVNTGTTNNSGADGASVEAKLMFADGTTSVVTVDSVIVNNSATDDFELDSGKLQAALGISSSSTLTPRELLDCYLSGGKMVGTGTNAHYECEVKNNSKTYNQLLKAGTIAPALVTYSRSGGDYTLQLLDQEENDAGYDNIKQKAEWTRGSDGQSGDAKVNTWNLMDDGTVFVVYGSSSVKRYTGAQAKKLSVTKTNSTDSKKPDDTLYNVGSSTSPKANAYALVEKSNGVSRVRVAAVYAQSEPKVSGVGNYAYLLDKTTSKTIDGTSYIVLTAYTKNGAETLYVEKGASFRNSYDKGDIVDFAYTTSNITDNGTEYKLVDDVNTVDDARYAAIVGWDRDDISILVANINGTGTNAVSDVINNLDVDTDDTTVLVVDTDGKVGVSVGKEGIQVADNPGKDKNGKEIYKVNAKVYYGNDDSYDLIVVDSVNNWMDEGWEIIDGVRFTAAATPDGDDDDDDSSKTAQQKLEAGDPLTANEVQELLKDGKEVKIPANRTQTLYLDDIPFVPSTVSKAYSKNDVYRVEGDTVIPIAIDWSNIVGTDETSKIKFAFKNSTTQNDNAMISLAGLGDKTFKDLKNKTFLWDTARDEWK